MTSLRRFATTVLPHHGGGADVRNALRIVSRARQEGVPLSLQAYSLTLEICAKGHLPEHHGGAALEEAKRVWQLMRDDDVVPDAAAYTNYMRCFARARGVGDRASCDLDGAWNVLTCTTPNATIFTHFAIPYVCVCALWSGVQRHDCGWCHA